MNYIQRNKTAILIGFIGFLLGISVLVLWVQKRMMTDIGDIRCNVYPSKINLGDTLFYADHTSIAAIKKWEFGDGNISVNDSGYYIYNKAGYFQVTLTLNEKYSKSFPVEVVDNRPKGTLQDSLTTIEGPHEAMQYENVVFRAKSKSATMFSWSFGESKTIDSKEDMVIYAYKNPGNYMITLYTDQTAYPITYNIKINPAFKLNSDTVSVEDMYSKIDNDIKGRLQQIADGKDFNGNYNYLLNKYLCKNENTVVKVNTSKINSFYYYCAGLRFDRNVIIQSAKAGFDEGQNCVIKIEISQSK